MHRDSTSDQLGERGDDVADRAAADLDDRGDREELRERYYGLLQELRVVLPGVQVLMAFLLTAPFAARFGDLDDLSRGAYRVALVSSTAATICFIAPTVHHRAGGRTARSTRLVWAIRWTRVGFVLLALALLSSVWTVTRFVGGPGGATWTVAALGLLLVGSWVVLPLIAPASSGSDVSAERHGEQAGRPGR